MSEIWYRVTRLSKTIEATEWDRSTDDFLIRGNRREGKATNWAQYFREWIQAKAYILSRINGEINNHDWHLKRLIDDRIEVEAMRETSHD